MDFLLILFLTVINGLFAMSEMAIVSGRKARLTALHEAGDRGAGHALALMAEPTQFLSTVQVGITATAMLNGIVGEAAFSERVALQFKQWGGGDHFSEVTATVLVVTAITFVTIVFGELVPKRIGQLYAESVARWVAGPMRWIARVCGPFVRLLSTTTAWTLRLLRVNTNHARAVTEEEISASLEEGLDAGVIEAHEHLMVRNVFMLDDRPLTSIMVPISEIDWLDVRASPADCLSAIGGGAKACHSWYPVCRGSLESVLGVISVARLLQLNESHGLSIEEHMSPATFVPETLSGLALLEQLRATSARVMLVVDEYGSLQGMVTPGDLLQAITGELQPHLASDAWATLDPQGGWQLDGLMPVSELKARLDIRELPDEDRGLYNTVAGLWMAISGRLPAIGERVSCGGWWFEVTALEGRRIVRLRAARARPAPNLTF